MREPAAAHISANGTWELTLVQLQAGTTLRQPFGICQPSPTLHAAVLGGSVTAGLTYAVRQDPKRFLYHAKFAAKLSARIGGAVHMWNGGIPATGPWIANICTRARRPHVFNMLLLEARPPMHDRTCTAPPLKWQDTHTTTWRSPAQYAINTEPSDLNAYEELLRWASPLMPVIAVHSPWWACGSGGRPMGVALPMRPNRQSIEEALDAIETRHGVSTVSLARAIDAAPQPVQDTSFMADCRHVGDLGHAMLAQLIDHVVAQRGQASGRRCEQVPWNERGQKCFMGETLRDLAGNASNFTIGEYAPHKLALIPQDASGIAALRVHIPRRSILMLGRVVSWKHEQTDSFLRCVGGCACAEHDISRWHKRKSTTSEPLEIAIAPRPWSNKPCSLLFDRPPLVTAIVVQVGGAGRSWKNDLHLHLDLGILGGDRCIGTRGRRVGCGIHVWSNGTDSPDT